MKLKTVGPQDMGQIEGSRANFPTIRLRDYIKDLVPEPPFRADAIYELISQKYFLQAGDDAKAWANNVNRVVITWNTAMPKSERDILLAFGLQ